jgi:hypothetical protein
MEGLRLYLDTADLITIGDGKEESTTVELLALCEQLRVVLMVSLWHVVDARNADDASRSRILRAIDRFPYRALARVDGMELAFMTFDSFEVLCDENTDYLQRINSAANQVTEIAQSAPPPAKPGWELNLVKRALLDGVAKASTKEEAIERARAIFDKERRRLPKDRTAQMLTSISDVWDIRIQLEAAGIWCAEVVTEALTTRAESAVPDQNPGRHIGVLVDQHRSRQLDRAHQSGDAADIHHANFAPHVDIFTGDHDICTWLKKWRSSIPYVRDVQPLGSGKLGHVLALLRAWPPHGSRRENE